MNEMSPQRKKVVVLGASLACFSGPGMLITRALHGPRYLPTFVIVWSLLMAALLAYTVVELTKLKRSEG
jgi:hypothetical protein